jgi:hypothetical protein
MNPAGLRLVASLGYETLAFHRDYLAKNPWIASVPWLERIETGDEWLICRAGPELARFPERSLESLLDRDPGEAQPREVPPGCWITGTWPVEQDVIITGSEGALLSWSDDHGRLLSGTQPAFYQHVFGPGIPAYAVRTPEQPGSYHLVVLDRELRRRAKIGYRIVRRLPVAQPVFPGRRPTLTVHPIVLQPAATGQDAAVSLSLVNTSGCYVQSLVFRENVRSVARAHPGLRSNWPKADAGALVLRIVPIGGDTMESSPVREIPLPEDLPPGGRLRLVLRADRLPASWAKLPWKIEPAFAGVGEVEVPPPIADLRISEERLAPDVAGSPPTAESRTR